MPRILIPVAKALAFLVPLAVIVGGFLLANDKLAGGLPAPAARWLILLAFWPSTLFAGVFVLAKIFNF